MALHTWLLQQRRGGCRQSRVPVRIQEQKTEQTYDFTNYDLDEYTTDRGMPDHTTDNSQETPTAQRKENGTWTLQNSRRAHRRAAGPPPRGSEGKSQVRYRQGEKWGRGMLLGKEVSAVSAALGAAVVDPGLDRHVAHARTKCANSCELVRCVKSYSASCFVQFSVR